MKEQFLTEQEFLKQYNPGDYERPSVTVDTILIGVDSNLKSLKVLLIKRKNHPFMNCWAFPGGFINMKESSYEAAIRELEEETGLKDIYLEQLYTYSNPNRDPRMRVIDIAYLALVPVTPVKANDDAAEAAWFDIDFSDNNLILKNNDFDVTIKYDLKTTSYKHGVISVKGFETPVLCSKDSLAFDHASILIDTMLRLRNKVEYTDIAFNLVPKHFTLTDLQHVYELLLGKNLYKKNFRTKVISKVNAINDTAIPIISIGTKPAQLYEYKEEI